MGDDEEMGNGISDLWDELIKFLNGKGKVGKFFAQVMEKYKDRVVAMIKKLMSAQGEGLIKIIEEIKDDIIKIINGGHIYVLDDEEMDNGITDLWEKLIAFLNGKGKVGKFVAKVMEKYKDRVVAMIK